jgi:hypothetical protein
MISRRTSCIAKEEVFPTLLNSDSTCSQVFPDEPECHYIGPVNSNLSPGHLDDVIRCHMVCGSGRAVSVVWYTPVYRIET